GRDGGERLAREADSVTREHAFILHAAAVAYVGHVGSRDHGAHTGEPSRATGVDPHESRVRLMTPEHLAVEHAGQSEVGGVQRRASYLTRRVHAGDRAADD